jgi:hypothetical protein
MRTVLRLIGTRYGIALILALLVLGIVGIGKAVTGDNQAEVPIGPAISPPTTPGPTGPTLGDDSLVDPVESESSASVGPSLSPNAPSPNTVASRFITAWLRHTGVSAEQWRAGLAPHATSALMAKLKDTDPSGVPANSVTGEIQTVDRGSVVEANVPVNGGTVRLRLVAQNGRWQVDGIDWDPA